MNFLSCSRSHYSRDGNRHLISRSPGEMRFIYRYSRLHRFVPQSASVVPFCFLFRPPIDISGIGLSSKRATIESKSNRIRMNQPISAVAVPFGLQRGWWQRLFTGIGDIFSFVSQPAVHIHEHGMSIQQHLANQKVLNALGSRKISHEAIKNPSSTLSKFEALSLHFHELVCTETSKRVKSMTYCFH